MGSVRTKIFLMVSLPNDHDANQPNVGQQHDVLGDMNPSVGVPAPVPALPDSPMSVPAIRDPDRNDIIMGCRHYWSEFCGNTRDERQCELCRYYLPKVVWICVRDCKIKICMRCRRNNYWVGSL
ncbi:uncharacterized protein TRIVIDRAFT_219933 [Trichoderma virens Gv29-8]|uniref:Uncharacterized protein n=1 Tax=Hypocrea virens (strain Gv29-8 / FGSC 10586) TaxID=413071 RepID=G9MMA9_HYPVG|nr:uncharacterized protein TRIVIDRAFT_219933 [Trichoderma virens Gv29-8]EHK24478.1 hypothetical protein TRIVIDRAFT_219933 [Trichoderma virens Gv29-8]UKZ54750.1 hypothetical protein TrVGV298_008562 [Trichoderma virens]